MPAAEPSKTGASAAAAASALSSASRRANACLRAVPVMVTKVGERLNGAPGVAQPHQGAHQPGPHLRDKQAWYGAVIGEPPGSLERSAAGPGGDERPADERG